MNQTQVQVFRLLLRNLQASLVDLSYGFTLKNPENPKEAIVVPLILSIDDNLRSILSTFDEKAKSEVVCNYFSMDYLKIVKFKEKYEPIFINDIRQLKKDFISFIKKESVRNTEENSPSQSTNCEKFDVLKEKITSKLNVLDSPFNDISSAPFDIVEYFLSIHKEVPYNEENVKPFINRGYLYIFFFKFLRQLHLLENYKTKFEEGDIPSDCSQHLVDANYVPDQVQSTKVIMPLVKTPKIDPSIPNWTLLPKEPNTSDNSSTTLTGKFAGLKLNGLLDTQNNSPNILNDNQNENNINNVALEPNITSSTEEISADINSNNTMKMNQQPSPTTSLNDPNINFQPTNLYDKSNIVPASQNMGNDANNVMNGCNNDNNKNNSEQTNISKPDTNDKKENDVGSHGNQKTRIKGCKIGSTNSKNLSNLKLGSKSALTMLQRSHPKSSPKKSENSDNDGQMNNNSQMNNNNQMDNSNQMDNNNNNIGFTNSNGKIDNNVSPSVDINSNNNILSAIKGMPGLNDNNNDMCSTNFLEDYQKGVIAINNNVYNDINNGTANEFSTSIPDDGDSTLNRYARMVQKLETSKQQLREWSQIIIARLQQKALLLQKENQLLRENLDIVSKQKSEIVEMYETQINELSEQSEFLRKENMKLKEKAAPIKNDEG